MRRLLLLLVCLPLASCENGGHFTILGYTTKPNYDTCIKTVYVPIFENKTFRRGLEFDLTQAVIKEIEWKTPYKVVSDRDKADTELTGTIVAYNKNILNRNQLNEIREGEMVLTVAVVWKDLHTGEILSQPRAPGVSGPAFAPLPDLAPGAGGVPTLPNAGGPPCPPTQPAIVASTATYAPEIGQSNASAQQINVNRLATQIVSLMEKPW
jgi:Lipopolysaccharide-assembly